MPAGRPRKPVAFDPSQVEKLARIGCTGDEIASVLRVSRDTLDRNYAEVLKRGRDSLRVSLRRKQVQQAMKGDRTMLIWLGKQLLGQRDQQHIEASIEGGIQVTIREIGKGKPEQTPEGNP